MMNRELTTLVNFRLQTLEDQIKARPTGGDFDGLRAFLGKLSADIQGLKKLLDKLDKTPKNTPKK